VGPVPKNFLSGASSARMGTGSKSAGSNPAAAIASREIRCAESCVSCSPGFRRPAYPGREPRPMTNSHTQLQSGTAACPWSTYYVPYCAIGDCRREYCPASVGWSQSSRAPSA
jgi:hypothetical protein